MNVADTVKRLMLAYPSLYPTRLRVLVKLFDSPDWAWVNGELVLVGPDEYGVPHEPRDPADMQAQFDRANDRTRAGAAGALLMVLRANAQAQFTVDHAHLLSLDDSDEFDYIPRIKGLRWQDMPEDVTPDWKRAATDLATAVLAYSKPSRGTDPDRVALDAHALACSKQAARHFLDQHYPRPIPESEREGRMAALRAEAAALGVEVTA